MNFLEPIRRRVHFRRRLKTISQVNSLSLSNLFQRLYPVESRLYKHWHRRNGQKAKLCYAPTACQLRVFKNYLNEQKTYFKNIISLTKAINGNVILDVGANIGYYARGIATLNSDLEIIGFEPDTKNLGFAGMNLSDCKNVVLYQVGLTDIESRNNLAIPSYAENRRGESKYNSGLLSAVDNNSPQGIRFINGDKFLNVINLDPMEIGWIKIDVEGFELKVLNGLRSTIESSNAAIEVELFPQSMTLAGNSFNDFYELTKSLESKILKPKGSNFKLKDGVPSSIVNALIVKNKFVEITSKIMDFEIID